MVWFHKYAMGAQVGADPFQVLERIPDDGPVLLQDCNELSSLTLCQLVADEDWHATVDVGGGHVRPTEIDSQPALFQYRPWVCNLQLSHNMEIK